MASGGRALQVVVAARGSAEGGRNFPVPHAEAFWHAYLDGGAGVAPSGGAATPRVASLPGAPAGERLRAVRAAYPQPGLRAISLADHRGHLLRSRTPSARARLPMRPVCGDRWNARLAVRIPHRQRARPRSPIYAEVACTGRVFVDSRGGRAQRIEILRLASPDPPWKDPDLQAQAVAELSERYRVDVCGLDVVPQWVVANVMPQGAPPEDAAIDLDALLRSLGQRSPY